MNFAQAVLQLFDRHVTVRRFTDDPIPPEHLQAIVRAGQRAPSGATAQLATFIRVTDRALRRRLAHLADDQQQVMDAAEFLVACVDTYRERRLIEHRGGQFGCAPTFCLFYGLVDVALQAANMATAAEAMGYGVCYVGAIQNNLDLVTRELELPQGVLPVFGLCFGVPAEQPATKPRLPTRAVLMENRYAEPTPELLDECYRVMAATTRSGDWFLVLRRYFAQGGVGEVRETVLRRALEQQGFTSEGTQGNLGEL